MLNKLKEMYQNYKMERQLDAEMDKQLESLIDPVFIERVLKNEDRRTIHSN